MKRSLTIVLMLLVSACALDPIDETRDLSPDRIYSAAQEELEGRNYQKAIALYEKLESRYPYGRLAQQAQIEIAYAYWKDGEPAQALAACDRFIRLHPDHPNVDYAYYLKGRINFNEDMGLLGYLTEKDMTERDPRAAQEAFDAFKELTRRFPESRYAPDAHARMAYLVNALAAAEVNVAEYYLRRGAYVAAVNRAQYALINYPQTPAVQRALKVMVVAYNVMGLAELSDDARRTLDANFPETKVVLLQPKAWWKFW